MEHLRVEGRDFDQRSDLILVLADHWQLFSEQTVRGKGTSMHLTLYGYPTHESAQCSIYYGGCNSESQSSSKAKTTANFCIVAWDLFIYF